MPAPSAYLRPPIMQDFKIGHLLDPAGPASSLPELPDEKAKQMPVPKTYHLLCIVPEAEAAYDSGILKAGKTTQYEELLSPVLFVVAIG